MAANSIYAQTMAMTQKPNKQASAPQLDDRRRSQRVPTLPAYTAVAVRVLTQRQEPMEGHVLNVSETGLAVELDDQLLPGSAVTVEFCVSGLGDPNGEEWPTHRATAEVVRNGDVEDFPAGPYQAALNFIHIGPAERANIASFVAGSSKEHRPAAKS